nr:SH3 domain-containing protein [Gemmobacter straminiformis]
MLVSLCLALYCGMVIWGDGPARKTSAVAPVVMAAQGRESGIRVLPAPKRPVRIGPQVTEAAGHGGAVPAAKNLPARVTANERLAALVLATLDRHKTAMAPAEPANLARRWVTANTANVRSGPNKRSALAGKIGRGGEVWVLWSEPNGWVRLRAADGTVAGFVHKSLLTDAPPAETRLATAG